MVLVRGKISVLIKPELWPRAVIVQRVSGEGRWSLPWPVGSHGIDDEVQNIRSPSKGGYLIERANDFLPYKEEQNG